MNRFTPHINRMPITWHLYEQGQNGNQVGWYIRPKQKGFNHVVGTLLITRLFSHPLLNPTPVYDIRMVWRVGMWGPKSVLTGYCLGDTQLGAFLMDFDASILSDAALDVNTSYNKEPVVIDEGFSILL